MRAEGVLTPSPSQADSLRRKIAHRTTLDSSTGGPRNPRRRCTIPRACTAMDVVEILRKKRLVITAYEVLMSGERAEQHPRRFLSLEFVHRVTGRGIPRPAAEEALRLAHEKYCSVSATLRPDVPARHVLELLEG
jgi:putative redox protein